jgi:hypothetical protein
LVTAPDTLLLMDWQQFNEVYANKPIFRNTKWFAEK